MRWLALMLALLAAQPLLADSNLPPAYWSDRQLPDPKQEARAQALMEEIRCLVCQGQSIADSDASMAGDMRSEIRQRIAAGESPEHIRRWLIGRYGEYISYKPRVTSTTWPLFVVPVLLVLAAVLVVLRRLRARG